VILFLIFDIFMNIYESYVHWALRCGGGGGGVNDYCSTLVGTIEILINFTF